MGLHVVLYQPEIPPNTGNIMRLCANTSTMLHLIHPLGFALDSTKLKRAGMDYREWADVREYDHLDDFLVKVSPGRVWAYTRDGNVVYSDIRYADNDALLFGPESVGLPDEVVGRADVTGSVRIPMVARSRSLNLSNSVAIGIYEAGRQLGYPFG